MNFSGKGQHTGQKMCFPSFQLFFQSGDTCVVWEMLQGENRVGSHSYQVLCNEFYSYPSCRYSEWSERFIVFAVFTVLTLKSTNNCEK